METRDEEWLCLTKNNIDQVRYIKLDKKAGSQQDKLNPVIAGQRVADQKIQFYAFGFYDSLTCVKTEMRISQAHKKHFLIKYPYQKTAEALKVEQWFGILPLAEGGRFHAGVENAEGMEPFFCREDLQAKMPFVGVVLISLRNTAKDFKSGFCHIRLCDPVRIAEELIYAGERRPDVYPDIQVYADYLETERMFL